MRILLVEDDARMSDVIAKGLREQSYALDVPNRHPYRYAMLHRERNPVIPEIMK